ncbi:MAG: arylsulfatase [Bacteroidetes bacterium]|nr:arylsulfatase [Bacteroidota bacterium]
MTGRHNSWIEEFLNINLLCAAIIFGLSACSFEPENTRPNIVLLVADDLGWNDVGYHGSGIKTPNIDRLGENGAVLDQFYVMPACTPTRASLLTGRYTIRYGMQISVIKPHHRHGLPADERILPQALKEVGYETAIVGKWHLGLSSPEYLPTSRGFDHQYGCYTGMIDYVTHARNSDLNWRTQLVVMDSLEKPSDKILGNDWNRNDKAVCEKGFVTDLLKDEAIRVIRERDQSKALFLYVPFTAPHTPLQAKDSDLEQYENMELEIPDILKADLENRDLRLKRRRYYAALVSGMDDAIGEIMHTLEDQGMLDNTLVIFMSDNGGAYQGGNNDPLRGQKTQMYEGGVRVPAIISFPGRIEAGTFVDEPLHVVDLYPTLLQLTGASLQQDYPIDGIDIWATVTEGAESPHREILINAREGRSSAIRVGDWKLISNGHLGPVSTIGDEETRYELFNLETDPCEERNLVYENPLKFEELKLRLNYYTEAAVDPLVTSNPKSNSYPRIWEPYWWEEELNLN